MNTHQFDRRRFIAASITTGASAIGTAVPLVAASAAEAANDEQLLKYARWLHEEQMLCMWYMDPKPSWASVQGCDWDCHEWKMREYEAGRSPRRRALATLRSVELL